MTSSFSAVIILLISGLLHSFLCIFLIIIDPHVIAPFYTISISCVLEPKSYNKMCLITRSARVYGVVWAAMEPCCSDFSQ